jgi:O-antigen chain-terminating methyltransferase
MTDTHTFYRAFEDRMRGSRELIIDRMQVYRPFLAGLLDLFERPAAMDIGCGRGEWLELLTSLGFEPRGIDLDDGMLAACRKRGLAVNKGDGVAYLAAMKAESMALISAFHVAEHLPFDRLQVLVKEALRVLRPGGLLIIETPNPENPVVGSHTFHLDPTHEKPLPPKLLEFLADYWGYHRTRIMRLQENQGVSTNPDPTLTQVFFDASPDFAIIAQKSAEPGQLALLDAPFEHTWGIDLQTLSGRYDAAMTARFTEVETRFTEVETRFTQQVHQALVQQRQAHQQERDALAAELKLIYGSRSWRLTRPLRWVSGQVRALRTQGLKPRIKSVLAVPGLWLAVRIDRYTRHNRAFRLPMVKLIQKLGLYNRLFQFYHTARMRRAATSQNGTFYRLTESQKAAQAAWMPGQGELTTEELMRRIREEVRLTKQEETLQ